MSEHINFQTIMGADGSPAFVVVPYTDFVKKYSNHNGLIPNEIAGKVLKDNVSIVRAWREYLGITQAALAEKMGVSQAAIAQFEGKASLRMASRRKIAKALNISDAQLDV
jgi:predicted transcriptional regulator